MPKLINFSDVNKRRTYTDRYLEEMINVESIYRLYENACSNIDYNSIHSFFESCKNSNADSFINEALDIINLTKDNENLSKYVIEEFSDVMGYMSDIKGLKIAISRADIDSNSKTKLLESANVYKVCDRIINNEEQIFKRFNLDKYIRDRRRMDLENIVFESCSLIDTYRLPSHGKLNVALEMLSLYLEKYGKEYDEKELVELCVEYFLINNDKNTETLEKYKNVLEKNLFIENSSIDSIILTPLSENDNVDTIGDIIKYIEVDNNPNGEELNSRVIQLIKQGEISIVDSISAIFRWIDRLILASNNTTTLFTIAFGLIRAIMEYSLSTPLTSRIKANKDIILDILDNEISSIKRKNNKEKDPNKIKAYEDYLNTLESTRNEYYIANIKEKQESLYKASYDREVDYRDYFSNNIFNLHRASDNVFKWFDKAIEEFGEYVSKTYGDKIYPDTRLLDEGYIREDYNYEYMKSQTSIDKELRRLEKQIAKLQKQGRKDDEEVLKALIKRKNEVLRLKKYNNSKVGKGAFKFGYNIASGGNVIGKVGKAEAKAVHKIKDSIKKKSAKKEGCAYFDMVVGVYTITEEATSTNIDGIVYKDLSEKIYEVCNNYNRINMNYYCYYEDYDNQFEIHLADRTPILLSEEEDNIVEDTISPIEEYYIDYNTELLAQINESVSLNEKFDPNNIKLMMQGVKKKSRDFNSKVQASIRLLDASMNNLSNSCKQALVSDRREGIIKGSVIPSFSKCVKIACSIGVVGVFSPVAAVTTAFLGFLGSIKLNRQERNLMIDEIEVELKVIEKEISRAEESHNTKNYRELLKQQRRLQREKARLKYAVNDAAANKILDVPKD